VVDINSRQLQAQQTKAHIIEAALEIIKTQGLNNLKVRDICAKANVSTGAYYHYFDSKLSVVQVIAESFDDHLSETLRSYKSESAVETLLFIFLEQAEFIMSQTQSYALTKAFYGSLISMDRNYIFDQNRVYYQAIYKQVSRCIDEGIFEKGHTVSELTEYFYRSARGMIFDWCLRDCSYDLVEITRHDFDIAIKGLQK